MKIDNDKIQELRKNIDKYYFANYGKSLDDKNISCPNPEHLDKHPSATYYEEEHYIYCHVCDKKYDLFNLIQFNEGLSAKEAFKRACELYGTEQEPDSMYDICHKALLATPSAMRYLDSRGLNIATIKRFNLGYSSKYGNIVIPVTDNQYTVRNLEKDKEKRVYKQIKKNEEPTKIFNWKLATREKLRYCFVCEGEIDAMSFEQIGLNAVALRSVSNWKLLFDTFSDKNITFILALDNDIEGKLHADELYIKLTQLGFKEPKSFELGNYKDPNEMLVQSREEFEKSAFEIVDEIKNEQLTEAVNEESEKVKQEEVTESAEEEITQAEAPQEKESDEEKENEYDKNSNYFQLRALEEKIEQGGEEEPWSTGFKKLDKILDGGLKPSIYVLGAVPSIGKTTFVMQIADKVAENGHDVLVFSLEMTRKQLIEKSLSRVNCENETIYDSVESSHFLCAYHNTKLSEHQKALIRRAKEKYNTYNKNIFIVENKMGIRAEDIKKCIDKHIKERKKKPFVVIDFMQLVTPRNDTFSDKQNMDNLMVTIKKCKLEYEIPIMLVSSINRENYTQKMSLQSLKESGGIEYLAEVVLGMQFRNMNKAFDLNLAKMSNPREVEILVLKNRFGVAGVTIPYDYYPAQNFFEEVELSLDEGL